jgi:hypothetical protein
MLGRFEEAWGLLDHVDEVMTEIHVGRETAALAHRGNVAFIGDHPEAAAPAFRSAYEKLMSIGDVGHASTYAGMLAEALLRLGKSKEAGQWAAECRQLSSSDDVVNQHVWRRVEAVTSAREGRDDDAAALINDAVEWVTRTDSLIDIADVYLCEAEVHALAGRTDQAHAALARAAETFEAKGATVGQGIVARRREELGLADGHP